MHPVQDLKIFRLDHLAHWWPECRAIRERVFIDEQQVPVALEWDAADSTAVHLLARIDAQPVACARVLPQGYIGRMAVLPAWRRQGIGRVVLQEALAVCREWGLQHVQLSAQTHAVDFYAQAGFVVHGAPYEDANILHVDMVLKLV